MGCGAGAAVVAERYWFSLDRSGGSAARVARLSFAAVPRPGFLAAACRRASYLGFFALGLAVSSVPAQTPPQIQVTALPAWGTSDYLQGVVSGIAPANYQIAVLIFIEGLGWYSKPYCDPTLTTAYRVSIQSDGTWSTPIATGGVDGTAIEIAMYLLPGNVTIGCFLNSEGLPPSLDSQAVARLVMNRPNPNVRKINFAGQIWDVKTNTVPLSPGPCVYSDSVNNVWVDSAGLHLKITNQNGGWQCTEIESESVFGHGAYTFNVGSAVSNLDPNIVQGLFTWSNDPASAHREIDVEFSRFGRPADTTNSQFVVQPFSAPGQLLRYTLPAAPSSTHTFDWESNSVEFTSSTSAGVAENWTETAGVPSLGDQRVHINLWLYNGIAPAAETEVVISGFGFVPAPTRFIPVVPCRVADTRVSDGAFGSPALAPGTVRDFPVSSGGCAIPSNAEAYSLNATVVPRGALGYLTVWPSGRPQPLASTLNSLDGRVKASAAIVSAGTGGAVSVYATDATDLVLDIDGYFVPATDMSALAFYPLAPCRLADTRSSSYGALGQPSLSAGQTRTFPILSSSCNVPVDAVAYSLNFTVAPPGPLGFITTYPAGQALPLASTLNAPGGAVTANAAIVPAGSGGAVDVYASDATDLIIDINGYFAPPGVGGMSLYNLNPCRVLDTRQPAGSLPFSGEEDVNVAASGCGLSAGALAYVFNATVVPPAPLGYLTLWPQGAAKPWVSTLNALDGAVTSNMAVVPTSNGSIAAAPSDPTQLVLDIFGYFAP